MNAPDRSSQVAAWVSQNRALFTGDADAKTRELLVPLCQRLNGLEGRDVWGLLVKTDRHPEFIPHDIIMWRDTGEHFDVFTGPDSGKAEDVQPVWGHNNPPENPAWEWRSVAAATPQPGDQPAPTPTPTPTPVPDSGLSTRVAALEARLAGLVDANQQLSDRVRELESRPALTLPEFVVEGNTGRVYGHAHPIRLVVVPR